MVNKNKITRPAIPTKYNDGNSLFDLSDYL